MVRELTRDKTGAELELIEDLSAEAISLGVRLNGIVAYDKLSSGVILICSKIYLLGTVRQSKNLLCLLTFIIVYVAKSMKNVLGDYVLTVKLDSVGNRFDKRAFAVYIIYN